MKTYIIIEILLLVISEAKDASRGRRSTTKLPKMEFMEAFDFSDSVPHYHPLEINPNGRGGSGGGGRGGGGGFFSTLRLLGKFGSRLFDKALDRINTWAMGESISKPVYASFDSLQPGKSGRLPKFHFASDDFDERLKSESLPKVLFASNVFDESVKSGRLPKFSFSSHHFDQPVKYGRLPKFPFATDDFDESVKYGRLPKVLFASDDYDEPIKSGSIPKVLFASDDFDRSVKSGRLPKVLFASDDFEESSLPSTHSVKYEPFEEPSYLELVKNWWNPNCKYCYDDYGLLEHFPTYSKEPIVKFNYDEKFRSYPPRNRANRTPMRYQIKQRRPLRMLPKQNKVHRNKVVWNPVTSSKDYLPPQQAYEYVQKSSESIPVVKKYPGDIFPTAKKHRSNVSPASTKYSTSTFPEIKHSNTFSVVKKYRESISFPEKKYPGEGLKILLPPKTKFNSPTTTTTTTTTTTATPRPSTATTVTTTETKTLSFKSKSRKTTTLRPFRKPYFHWKTIRTTKSTTQPPILETSTEISYSVIRRELPNNDTRIV